MIVLFYDDTVACPQINSRLIIESEATCVFALYNKKICRVIEEKKDVFLMYLLGKKPKNIEVVAKEAIAKVHQLNISDFSGAAANVLSLIDEATRYELNHKQIILISNEIATQTM
jgi:hypothetical protein